MPAAARTGDSTAHGGVLGAPPPTAAARVSTVLICGRPAAVVGTTHTCAVPQHAALGPSNVVLPGPPRPGGQVMIGGRPAAVLGSRTTCGATVVAGAPNVFIGGVV